MTEIIAVEVATNTKGDLLWVRRYPMSRIGAPGDTFIENAIEYKVIASAYTEGKHGAGLVEHVCEEIGGAGELHG